MEEVDRPVAHIAEHFVELLLGIKSVVLAEGGIVVAEVLEDLLVEAVPERGDNIDACSKPAKNV